MGKRNHYGIGSTEAAIHANIEHMQSKDPNERMTAMLNRDIIALFDTYLEGNPAYSNKQLTDSMLIMGSALMSVIGTFAVNIIPRQREDALLTMKRVLEKMFDETADAAMRYRNEDDE